MSYLHNHSEEVARMLRYLESLSFPTKELWAYHTELMEKESTMFPDEEDMKYHIPKEIPLMEEHVEDGKKEFLAPHKLWLGYSYRLTPGQKRWLKDTYGMTPTKTVTVREISTWKGTDYPRRLMLVSDIHVDPKNRRHVLTKVTLSRVGHFFTEAKKLGDAPKKKLSNPFKVTKASKKKSENAKKREVNETTLNSLMDELSDILE